MHKGIRKRLYFRKLALHIIKKWDYSPQEDPYNFIVKGFEFSVNALDVEEILDGHKFMPARPLSKLLIQEYDAVKYQASYQFLGVRKSSVSQDSISTPRL